MGWQLSVEIFAMRTHIFGLKSADGLAALRVENVPPFCFQAQSQKPRLLQMECLRLGQFKGILHYHLRLLQHLVANQVDQDLVGAAHQSLMDRTDLWKKLHRATRRQFR